MLMEMKEVMGDFFILNKKVFAITHLEKPLNALVHSKSVYEVIRVEEGIPLFVDDYLERLSHSMKEMDFAHDWSKDEIMEAIQLLIKVNQHRSGPVKMMLSAGNENLFVAYLMRPHVPSPEQYIKGVPTVLFKASRNQPGVKMWNREMRQESSRLLEMSGVYEALLVEPGDTLTEASRSNVFFVRDMQIYTTPVELVLPGITRKKVIEVCEKLKIPVHYEIISLKQLGEFDACFLTGTARKIVPVKTIDDLEFDVNDPIVKKISKAFDALVDNYISSVNTCDNREQCY